ncbi:MAG TPA: Rrf2 family transcriptional regulator [Firmicutes bacterium]|nr:Rrf2 family transcriptional regulator [Bacillota bacterium]HHY97454.1 Rrf2 family transcriptional regulator [Bacillota bacterium]
MMKLSTRARYGVRAMCALALMSKDGKPVALAHISEREGISKGYLALIFHKLRQSGLVEAERGINGGFRLAKNPGDITVASVIRALEGPIAPVDCLGPPGRSAASRCKRKQHCLSRPAWLRLQLQIEQALDAITIASLVKMEDQDEYPDIAGGTQYAE